MSFILFDLDGTLVDSSRGIKNAFHYAFRQLNFPLPSDEVLRTFIGPPLEDSFRRYFSDELEVSKAVTIYRDYYNEKGVYEVELYPDVTRMLDRLTTYGHKLYITSSKNEPMISVMLSHLGILGYFTNVYGDTATRTNKTAVIAACLAEENVPLDQAIIVGDTKYDMIGGKNTGIGTIGVTWGFGLEEELLLNGADCLCHSPLEIENSLETM